MLTSMLPLLFAPSAVAAPQVGALVQPIAEVDIASDRDGEDLATVHTFVRAFVRNKTKRGDAYFFETRLQHHLLAGSDVEAWYELSLGETGWDGRLGGARSPVRLRIGALRERWGKLNLLPVLDVINPTDARSGFAVPSEWQRQPLPMAIVQVGRGAVRSETVLIPWAGADRLWLRDTDWSPVRQDMVTEFFGNEASGWTSAGQDSLETTLDPLIDSLGANAASIDPSLRRAEDASTNFDGLPQAIFVNGEILQRIEFRGKNVDLAVVGGAMRSRFPQAVLDREVRVLLEEERLPDDNDELIGVQEAVVQGTALEVTWPRTWLAGLETSALVGPLQVRGEAGFWSDRVVRRFNGRAQTLPQLSAGLGVDYVRGSSLQISVEGRWQHLFDAPDDLVFSRPDQIQVAAGLRAGLAAERFELTLGGAYDFTFQEGLARPAFAWRASDSLRLEVGAILLAGATPPPQDNQFGLQEALTYEGGPMSFWSENDSVLFSLTWVL